MAALPAGLLDEAIGAGGARIAGIARAGGGFERRAARADIEPERALVRRERLDVIHHPVDIAHARGLDAEAGIAAGLERAVVADPRDELLLLGKGNVPDELHRGNAGKAPVDLERRHVVGEAAAGQVLLV